MDDAFELQGVTHLIRPWGEPAGDLQQLRQGIAVAPPEVLFRHAVQYPLRDPGAEELPPDDFSAWIGGVVQDAETAERLSFAVQGGSTSPEALRAAALAVLDAVPERRRRERDTPPESRFQFLAAGSLSHPVDTSVRNGQELVDALAAADASVWFFHLVEQPWYGAGRAPLLEWLAATADRRLGPWLREAAGSGLPIDKARARVSARWRRSRIGRRVTEATTHPHAVRREAGRRALARLLRRGGTGSAG
jgi:hypothetical protein